MLLITLYTEHHLQILRSHQTGKRQGGTFWPSVADTNTQLYRNSTLVCYSGDSTDSERDFWESLSKESHCVRYTQVGALTIYYKECNQ